MTSGPGAVVSIVVSRGGAVWWQRPGQGAWLDDGAGAGFRPVAAPAAWGAVPAGAWVGLAGDHGVTAVTADATGVLKAWRIDVALPQATPIAVDPERRRVHVATAVVDGATAVALSADRRRLYVATPRGLRCVEVDSCRDDAVVDWPAGTPPVDGLAIGPAGLVVAATDRVLGVNPRTAGLATIAMLPAGLHGAQVAVDHRGMITLATADEVWTCRKDGTDLMRRFPV